MLGILLISVVGATLHDTISQVKGLTWLLPPVRLSLEMMDSEDSIKAIPSIFLLAVCLDLYLCVPSHYAILPPS